MQYAEQKWRPSIGLIIAAILALVLLLPSISLVFFRVYENQLIRQTESELIIQSAVYAAILAEEIDKEPANYPQGIKLNASQQKNHLKPLHPIAPSLDINKDNVLPPRPKAILPKTKLAENFRTLSNRFSFILNTAKKTTLIGTRILDGKGTVISGGQETGLNLSHIKEVSSALDGKFSGVIRQRVSDEQKPDLDSISRGGNIRIFTALPVVVNQHVVGIIYASRVPKDTLKAVYQQRHILLLAMLVVLAATLLMGWVLIRTISKPIHRLILRNQEIGNGNRTSVKPLKHHGTKELAQLSDSFLVMSEKHFKRADYINTFAAHVSHELKSPLTSTIGAIELLLDNSMQMSDHKRHGFLNNIMQDTERMSMLVGRLRLLALADNPPTKGECQIDDIVSNSRLLFPDTEINLINLSGENFVAMSKENAVIVFTNLIDNAVHHQADCIDIECSSTEKLVSIVISDNGTGISSRNADKIFQLFFTTRRERGGSGLGLSIVQSLLFAHNGSIGLIKSGSGGAFKLEIPAA